MKAVLLVLDVAGLICLVMAWLSLRKRKVEPILQRKAGITWIAIGAVIFILANLLLTIIAYGYSQ